MRPFALPALALLTLASACGGGTSEPDSGGTSEGTEPPVTLADGAVRPPDATSPGSPASAAEAGVVAAADAGALSSADANGVAADAGVGVAPRALRLPPTNGGLDYQLGGAYAPKAGVTIVSRDRLEAPAPGLYNICYVNGFQGQPQEQDFWLQQQPDLVLRDTAGKPIIDRDWNELLLDVGTADKRARLSDIIGGYIEGCAGAGYDAVEIDNLDSYTRSNGRLQMADAVAFIALLAQRAHQHGLAIAQKNSSDLVAQKSALGTDFVVAEECNSFDECDVYRAGYGEHVLMIEYVKADFQKGCAAYPNSSIVLRDRELVPAGSNGYVFDDC